MYGDIDDDDDGENTDIGAVVDDGYQKMHLDANDADATDDDAYENRKVSVDTADVTATDNDAL